MKKSEQKHMSRVADLGCIVCRNLGYGRSPAEIHHIRDGQGMSQRASNYEVLPLCQSITGKVDTAFLFMMA
nr:Ref family recombination enhancement nuclease [Wohlfahrtiimonas chitiniclastica]